MVLKTFETCSPTVPVLANLLCLDKQTRDFEYIGLQAGFGREEYAYQEWHSRALGSSLVVVTPLKNLYILFTTNGIFNVAAGTHMKDTTEGRPAGLTQDALDHTEDPFGKDVDHKDLKGNQWCL